MIEERVNKQNFVCLSMSFILFEYETDIDAADMCAAAVNTLKTHGSGSRWFKKFED